MKNKKIAWMLLSALLLSSVVITGCSQNDQRPQPRTEESSVVSVSDTQDEGPKKILSEALDFEYEKQNDDSGNFVIIKGGKNKIAFSAEVTEISIPDKLDGVPVKVIEDGAFTNYTALTKVQMPDTVEKIGEKAFFGCSKLNEIHFPNRLKEISSSAFSNCTALNAISLPDSVSAIRDMAFAQCSSLTDITMSRGITLFGTSVFDGTPATEQKDLGALYIDNILYKYNFGPNAKQEIDRLAAQGGLQIKNDTTVIAPLAFQGIEKSNNEAPTKDEVMALPTLNIILPASLKTIGFKGFSGMHLGTLEISADLAKNCGAPFYDSYLEKLTFSPTTTEINDTFFVNTSARHLEFPSGVEHLKNKILTGGRYETVIFNEGIKTIEQVFNFTALEDAEALKTVFIPSTVIQLGENGSMYDMFGSLEVEAVIKEKGTMHPNLTMYTPKGSPAEEYAKIHNIKCKTAETPEDIFKTEEETSKPEESSSETSETSESSQETSSESSDISKPETSETSETSKEHSEASQTSQTSDNSQQSSETSKNEQNSAASSQPETSNNSPFGNMSFPSF